MRLERRRCRQFRGDRLGAEAGKPLDHLGIFQRGLERCDKLMSSRQSINFWRKYSRWRSFMNGSLSVGR